MTRLAFEDLAIDRALDAATIRAGLAHVLDTKPETITVAETTPTTPLAKSIRVLCERRTLGGEFPLQLALSLRDKTVTPKQPAAALHRLCAFWKCRILVGGVGVDPYAMMLFTSDAQKSVLVDAGALDDHGHYVLDAGQSKTPIVLASIDGQWRIAVHNGERVLIGRGGDADIAIDDRTVARRQAYVSLNDGNLTVEDAGGPSGTFVNETLVRTPTAVRPGDHLRLGGITFAIQV